MSIWDERPLSNQMFECIEEKTNNENRKTRKNHSAENEKKYVQAGVKKSKSKKNTAPDKINNDFCLKKTITHKQEKRMNSYKMPLFIAPSNYDEIVEDFDSLF